MKVKVSKAFCIWDLDGCNKEEAIHILSGYMGDLEDARINIESYGYEGGVESCITYNREETPAEKIKREKIEQKEAALKIKTTDAIKKRELKELARLQKKYG